MKTVDVLLYDGVDELDLCGPFETLASCHHMVDGKWSDKRAFHVETMAEFRMTVECAHGMRVSADKPMTDGRIADIVLVPGGPGARKDVIPAHILEYLRKASVNAEVVASVCTGAFILGKAGLVDNRQVTTHHAYVDALQRQYPRAQVIRDKRVVIDGKNLMTSAGITAGIDLALVLITRYEGKEASAHAARRIEWPGRF